MWTRLSTSSKTYTAAAIAHLLFVFPAIMVLLACSAGTRVGVGVCPTRLVLLPVRPAIMVFVFPAEAPSSSGINMTEEQRTVCLLWTTSSHIHAAAFLTWQNAYLGIKTIVWICDDMCVMFQRCSDSVSAMVTVKNKGRGWIIICMISKRYDIILLSL